MTTAIDWISSWTTSSDVYTPGTVFDPPIGSRDFTATPAVGELLFCSVTSRPTDFAGAAPTHSVSSGGNAWTELGTYATTNHRISLFARVAEAGEAITVEFVGQQGAGSTASHRVNMHIARYPTPSSGAWTLNVAETVGTQSNVTSLTLPQVTADGAGQQVRYTTYTIRRADGSGNITVSPLGSDLEQHANVSFRSAWMWEDLDSRSDSWQTVWQYNLSGAQSGAIEALYTNAGAGPPTATGTGAATLTGLSASGAVTAGDPVATGTGSATLTGLSASGAVTAGDPVATATGSASLTGLSATGAAVAGDPVATSAGAANLASLGATGTATATSPPLAQPFVRSLGAATSSANAPTVPTPPGIQTSDVVLVWAEARSTQAASLQPRTPGDWNLIGEATNTDTTIVDSSVKAWWAPWSTSPDMVWDDAGNHTTVQAAAVGGVDTTDPLDATTTAGSLQNSSVTGHTFVNSVTVEEPTLAFWAIGHGQQLTSISNVDYDAFLVNGQQGSESFSVGNDSTIGYIYGDLPTAGFTGSPSYTTDPAARHAAVLFAFKGAPGGTDATAIGAATLANLGASGTVTAGDPVAAGTGTVGLASMSASGSAVAGDPIAAAKGGGTRGGRNGVTGNRGPACGH